MTLPALARGLSPRGLDPRANAITDALNGAVPWLWWPLDVPPRSEPLGTGAHALYVVHAFAGWAGLRAAGVRPPAPAAILLAFAGWAVFTAAWDRRALGGA